MSAITFDTLKFAERLEKAGLSREQASAIAEAQRESLSEALNTTLSTKSDIDGLPREMLEVENRLVKWGVALAIGQTAVIAALVK